MQVQMSIEELAERLRTARKALGLRQAELAERWGCNYNTISRIEAGKEPGMMGLFCDALLHLESEVESKKSIASSEQ
jgi:transcriptional regulator with XRE-family HTH domain